MASSLLATESRCHDFIAENTIGQLLRSTEYSAESQMTDSQCMGGWILQRSRCFVARQISYIIEIYSEIPHNVCVKLIDY